MVRRAKMGNGNFKPKWLASTKPLSILSLCCFCNSAYVLLSISRQAWGSDCGVPSSSECTGIINWFPLPFGVPLSSSVMMGSLQHCPLAFYATNERKYFYLQPLTIAFSFSPVRLQCLNYNILDVRLKMGEEEAEKQGERETRLGKKREQGINKTLRKEIH